MAINWDDMQIAVVDPDTYVITSDEDIYTLEAEQRMISFVGKQGEQGEPGEKGEAATIEIVSVQTLPPDSRNYVENIGDSHNAKLIFGLAQGAIGNTGNGIYSIEKTATVGLVDTYTITFTNGHTYSYEVTNGEQIDDIYTKTEIDSLLDEKADTSSLGTMSAIDDAPNDGNMYVRQNGQWVQLNLS